MSISHSRFEKWEREVQTVRGRDKDLLWRELYYYFQRCMFNARGKLTESALDQAHRVNDLMAQMESSVKVEQQ